MGFPLRPGGPGPTVTEPETGPVYGWVRLAPPVPPPRSAWLRWGRNLALFLATVASVFFVGAVHDDAGFNPASGVRLALGLLAILTAHEMGHYVAARLHRVDVTLPFFLPLPLPWLSLVGTLGAFIRIRAPIPNRRALFDIGIAGPLAGFLVALPVLWLGALEATVHSGPPSPDGLSLGTPLLFGWAFEWVRGPLPDGQWPSLGPLGLAAWFGLLVTALNLMPIGQFDGGHVTYSLFRSRAHAISRAARWVCVALIYFGPSWILWSVLVRLLGRRPHPPTLEDDTPVGPARIAVGVLGLAVFVVCFIPDPIAFSWHDAFVELSRSLADTPFARFLR